MFPFRRLNMELGLEIVRCEEKYASAELEQLVKAPFRNLYLTRCVTENEKKHIMSI